MKASPINNIINFRPFSFLLALSFLLLLTSSLSENKKGKDAVIKTVIIDAGHGGKDPGAVGKTAYEKDIALAIALKLGNYISTTYPEIKVVYTRTTDVFVELYKRAEIANRHQADLFISIHVNANVKTDVQGTSTYVMGVNRIQQNIDVATRENSVILKEEGYEEQYGGFDPNSPESYIIFSLRQNTYMEKSLQFAAFVQNQFRERAHRIDRGVKQAALIVLWNSTMPAVLIETGFISNPEEEQFLITKEGQDYIASAIFRAFRDYKNTLEGNYLAVTEFESNTNAVVADTTVESTNFVEIVPPEIPDIVFKVQIKSSSRPIDFNSHIFRGIENIEEIRINNSYKYVVGNETDFDAAVELQNQIRNKIPDAFVVAFKNGEKITVREAIQALSNQ